MALKRYQEIWSVSGRLSDNLGELAQVTLHDMYIVHVETESHIDFPLNL